MEILQIRAFSKRLCEKKKKKRKESLTILHLYTVCYKLFSQSYFSSSYFIFV